ncbi:hypothetical protein FKM82_029127 [Ascaphus truei]
MVSVSDSSLLALRAPLPVQAFPLPSRCSVTSPAHHATSGSVCAASAIFPAAWSCGSTLWHLSPTLWVCVCGSSGRPGSVESWRPCCSTSLQTFLF